MPERVCLSCLKASTFFPAYLLNDSTGPAPLYLSQSYGMLKPTFYNGLRSRRIFATTLKNVVRNSLDRYVLISVVIYHSLYILLSNQDMFLSQI